LLLDVGREAEQAHDLRHLGAGDPLAAGYVRLVRALQISIPSVLYAGFSIILFRSPGGAELRARGDADFLRGHQVCDDAGAWGVPLGRIPERFDDLNVPVDLLPALLLEDTDENTTFIQYDPLLSV
jgi:hypothetical protein